MSKRLYHPVTEEEIEEWREEVNQHLISAFNCKVGGINFYPEKLFADALEIVKTLRARGEQNMEDLKKIIAEVVSVMARRKGMKQDDYRNWIIAATAIKEIEEMLE